MNPNSTWQAVFEKLDEMAQEYAPWQECPQEYTKADGTPNGMVLHNARRGFEKVFGIAGWRMPREFRLLFEETIRNFTPRFRRSTLRAMAEGRIPGLPSMLPATLMDRKRLYQVLTFCDVLETMLFNYLEGCRSEMEEVEDSLSMEEEEEEDSNASVL